MNRHSALLFLNRQTLPFLSLMLLMLLLSCGPQESEPSTAISSLSAPSAPDQPAPDRLIAVLHPTEGNETAGTVTFQASGDGVRIEADITGLSPDARHGFHIHEYGDCSAPDASSAGGHYNPLNRPHGGPDDTERHMGDMGNLNSGSDGTAGYERIDRIIEISGTHTILGHAVIVHSGEDDFTTQPTGDAGSRLACGVIGIAQPAN